MDSPISFTVGITDRPSRPVVDNPPGTRDALLAEIARQESLAEEYLGLAAHLGVRLRLPTEQEHARYGMKPGLDFLFEPEDPDVADTVQLTRMIFNWRLNVLRKDMFGYEDILAHWCFNAGGNAISFVQAVRALQVWGGRIDGEPEGYVKKLDLRPETRAGRRAR